MKIRCNVCLKSPIIKLPEPEEDKIIYCPNCGKQLAYGYKDFRNILLWSILDNHYNKEWGGIPVEIIEL